MNAFPKFIAINVVVWAMAFAVRAEYLEFAFTGTGVNGSLAWGKFTTGGPLQPNYYAPGNVYGSFSLTISNIPGPGPGLVNFKLEEVGIFSIFSTDAASTPSILPLGGNDFGEPFHNHYNLGGGVEVNQSTLTYNNVLV